MSFYKSIAYECNLTTNTVFRVFKYINYLKAKLPKVLSIDEFNGNAGKKYQCILTDNKKTRRFLILIDDELDKVNIMLLTSRRLQEATCLKRGFVIL